MHSTIPRNGDWKRRIGRATRVRSVGAVAGLAVLFAIAWPLRADADRVSRLVNLLVEAAESLFPEVDSRKVVPAPRADEPAAVLTAPVRFEAASGRLEKASSSHRTFSGGVAAGAATREDRSVSLALKTSDGEPIGLIRVIAAGRGVRIEVLATASGSDSNPETFPVQPIEPEPVLWTWPLSEP